MKKILLELPELADKINPYSKWIIRLGSVLIFAVYLAAFVLALCAGWKTDYDTAMCLCEELLECGKECVGAVYIPAFLLEIFMLLGGKADRREK